MKKSLIYGEQVFTQFALITYFTGWVILVLSGGANEGEGVEVNYSTFWYQFIYVCIYFVTIFLLILRWKKVIHVFTKNRFIWLLLILSAMSVSWSFSPVNTKIDTFKLFCSSLFGVYLATRYTLKQQIEIWGVNFALVVILSIIFAVGLPKYGIMAGIHSGKWRGIFIHKNGLGVGMVYSCMIFLTLALSAKTKAWIYWCFLYLSILLLLLAASTSSIINVLILIAFFFVLRSLWLPFQVMVPTVIGISIVGIISFILFKENQDLIFGYLGKDSNLSGRASLWDIVYYMIWKQPWLGYGYGGFWHGWNGESASVWLSEPWTPNHPHSGFLALWLDLGLLGLLIFWIGFLISCLRSIILVLLYRSEEYIFPVIMMVYLIISNLSETALLTPETFMIYISFSSSTVISLNEYKNRKLIK
jgi:exopolysaccharide production protein ExoQ